MSDMTPQGTQAYGVENGYEHTDANVSSVLAGVAVILSAVFVCMAVVGVLQMYFMRVFDARDAAIPAAYKQVQVPPAPRLLPNPYTDTYKGAAMEAARTGERGFSRDNYPWEKRTDEMVNQYAEANAYGQNADGSNRIPIARAMELEAGGNGAVSNAASGTPAMMPWQVGYSNAMAGASAYTFDRRADWESDDEKFTAGSASGTNLHAGQGGGAWSR